METPAVTTGKYTGIDSDEEDSNFDGLRKKLFSPESLEENNLNQPVLVFLRVRPKSREEIETRDQNCLHFNDKEVIAVAPESSNTYKCNRTGECTQNFEFSRIFNESTSQQRLFEETLRPRLKDFCDGQNCLLFTYGVTNSGKSYTVVGTPSEPGLLPRALEVIFTSFELKKLEEVRLVPERFSELRRIRDDQELEDRLRNKEKLLNLGRSGMSRSGVPAGGVSCEESMDNMSSSSNITTCSFSSQDSHIQAVSSLEEFVSGHDLDPLEVANSADYHYVLFVSFAEIYNNLVYDLLEEPPETGKHRPSLKIQQDRSQNNFIKGLQEVQVSSVEEAMLLLSVGLRHRHVAATRLNYESSRGHAVFSLKLVRLASCVDQPTKALISRISIVDLAGAERSNKTGASGTRLTEASNINKDLFTLGRCIRSMMDNQSKRNGDVVPFRDSNLTKLFQNYFMGKEDRGMKRLRQGVVTMFINISNSTSTFDHTLQVLKFSAIANKVVPTVKSIPSLRNVQTPSIPHLYTPRPPAVAAAEVGVAAMPPTPGPCSHCRVLEKQLERYQQVADKQYMQMEYELRKELGKEFSEKLVEIEKEHRSELEEMESEYETMMDDRIKILQKSIKKSRKRRRSENEEDGEDVYNSKENLEARVKELEEELESERASAASSLRALANKYESEKTSANQQLMDLSLQLAEARKREAQLTSTTDTLREQVFVALEGKRHNLEKLSQLETDLTSRERSLASSRKELVALQKQSQETEAELKDRDLLVSKLEISQSDLMVQVEGLNMQVAAVREEGEMEAELLQERISEIQRELEAMTCKEKTEKDRLKETVSRLQGQLALTDSCTELEKELRQKVLELEESLATSAKRKAKDADSLKARVKELEGQAGKLEKEVEMSREEKEVAVREVEGKMAKIVQEKDAQLERLLEIGGDKQNRVDMLEAQKIDLKAELQNVKQAMKQVGESEASLKEQLHEKMAERLDLAKKLQRKNLEVQESRAELDRLVETERESVLRLSDKSVELERAKEEMAQVEGNSRGLMEECLRKIAKLESELGVVTKEKASLVVTLKDMSVELEKAKEEKVQVEGNSWELVEENLRKITKMESELGVVMEEKESLVVTLKGMTVEMEKSKEEKAQVEGNSRGLMEECLRKIAKLESELGVVMEEKESLVVTLKGMTVELEKSKEEKEQVEGNSRGLMEECLRKIAKLESELGVVMEEKESLVVTLKGMTVELEKSKEEKAQVEGNSRGLMEECLRKIAKLESELGVVMEEKESLVVTLKGITVELEKSKEEKARIDENAQKLKEESQRKIAELDSELGVVTKEKESLVVTLKDMSVELEKAKEEKVQVEGNSWELVEENLRKITKMESELGVVMEEKESLVVTLKGVTAELERSKEEKAQIEGNSQKLKEESQRKIAKLESELGVEKISNSRLSDQLENCRQSFKRLEAELQQRCDQLDSALMEEKVAHLKKVTSVESVLVSTTSDFQESQQQLKRIVEECDCLRASLSQEKALASGLAEEVKNLQENQGRLDEVQESLLAARSQAEEMQCTIEGLEKELESLRCLVHSFELHEEASRHRGDSVNKEEHIYEVPPESSHSEEATLYESILDDTKPTNVAESTAICDALEVSLTSRRSIEVNLSKPYLPILERSSLLMESVLDESTNRVIIDATPLPLRKKAAKRKRKEEKAKEEGTTKKKYPLRSRRKEQLDSPLPCQIDELAKLPDTPIDKLEHLKDENSPSPLKRLKKGLNSGKKALMGTRTSKRKLRNLDGVSSLSSVQSPIKTVRDKPKIQLGNKLRRAPFS